MKVFMDTDALMFVRNLRRNPAIIVHTVFVRLLSGETCLVGYLILFAAEQTLEIEIK